MDIKNSMLLANMMSGNKSQGTLNAEIVGSPTISDDFILSNFDDSNYLKFNPENPKIESPARTWKLTAKFKVGDLTKNGQIYMCNPDQTGVKLSYANDGAGQNGLSILVVKGSGTGWANTYSQGWYIISNAYTVANQWMWIRVEMNDSTHYLKVYTSTDGENDTQILDAYLHASFNYSSSNFSNLTYEQIGTGSSGNTIEIDLKECKYYIEDVLKWEAVSF